MPRERRIALTQLQSAWNSLNGQKKLIAVLAAAAILASVFGITRLALSPTMALLYGGLESSAAGEVVRALEQRGVRHQVRGDSIWVDERRRDEIRMTLAAEGMPSNGASGYELLDGLSGFGTTSQMFDAAYWRAKEGELARTITANPQIRAARVHIAHTGTQPFRREIRPTASVTVTTVNGGLAPAQARALRYMIASAVAGLAAEDVSVIDTVGGMIASSDETGTPAQQGHERALELRRNVERLLEARVGPGRAIVEVSVDTVTETEQILERRIDPESRVAISAETEERNSNSNDQGRAQVTVASNLPDGEAANGGGTSQSQSSESRERVNYEVSQLQREISRGPGATRRLSVAVLLDEPRGADGLPQLRGEEEISALRELVASAVGFDDARGDVITIKSMAFEPAQPPGEFAEASLFGTLDLMGLIQLAVLAVLALLLGLFVLRPLLSAKPQALPALPEPEDEMEQAFASLPPLSGEIQDMGELPTMFPVMGDIGMDREEESDDPVARLRRLIEERQQETAEILRGWMEEREGRA
ncbi:flagellar basal-body MS-ring/collar protein FliF [Halodurantibacterium flavum]|uniref:Flagellar M-ring protein n=1 Tax=Halodurantibacterium flavum TaxID=1382802 RepID=A0ABW4S7W0_9RHOB